MLRLLFPQRLITVLVLRWTRCYFALKRGGAAAEIPAFGSVTKIIIIYEEVRDTTSICMYRGTFLGLPDIQPLDRVWKQVGYGFVGSQVVERSPWSIASEMVQPESRQQRIF